MQHFQSTLKEQIEQLKFIQESDRALAERLQFSRQKVSKWLDGTSIPSKQALHRFMATIGLSQKKMAELELLRDAAKRARPRVRKTKGMLKNEEVYAQFLQTYDNDINSRYDDTLSFRYNNQSDESTIAVMGFCAETAADVFFRARHSIWANGLTDSGHYRVLVVVDDIDVSSHEDFLLSESISTITEKDLEEELHNLSMLDVFDNVVDTVHIEI